MLAVVILGALAYLLRRLGVLRIGAEKKAESSSSSSSPSSRVQRP
jgi:hypothetical protein